MSKGGRSAIARSRSIDQQLDEERGRREREVQLLILGPPGVGKSTFLKQVRLHHGDQFPPEERRKYHDQIMQNVATGLVQLMEHMERMGLKFDSPDTERLSDDFRKKHPRVSFVALIKKFKEADDEAEEICPATTKAELTKRLSSLDVYQPESPIVDHMHTLWADPSMQYCFSRRLKFDTDKLTQSSEYFLQHIGRICSADYVASIQDIMYICWPTLGIQEHTFRVDQLLYRMVDVAGQRSMRKKWIHFFEEAVAVLFFVSLASYDEPLEEDTSVNSLQDSLQAFNEVSHSHFLNKTEFILFLNKKDLLAQKLKTTPLSTCFPSYSGNQNPDSCIRYIKEQFTQNKPSQKQMYAHACCAIDVPFMKDLLSTVVDRIVDINLRRTKAM
ncbi:guanine nucleotide-binding protein G(o) subunit alpha isoform X2 [Aplysia californica]|nr:guanine nucleotide-binding protein G(o) subunit alpha isoform X2 [Aplysia californica]